MQIALGENNVILGKHMHWVMLSSRPHFGFLLTTHMEIDTKEN